MRKTIRTIGIASLIIGGLVALSPAYAQKEKQPSTQSDMMKDDGMGGMMGMMEQMNKMMGLCSKMMESAMDGTEKKPMESPAEPEKKG